MAWSVRASKAAHVARAWRRVRSQGWLFGRGIDGDVEILTKVSPALVYLHGSDERQHQIADTLSQLATEELKCQGAQSAKRSGTQRARNRKQAS